MIWSRHGRISQTTMMLSACKPSSELHCRQRRHVTFGAGSIKRATIRAAAPKASDVETARVASVGRRMVLLTAPCLTFSIAGLLTPAQSATQGFKTFLGMSLGHASSLLLRHLCSSIHLGAAVLGCAASLVGWWTGFSLMNHVCIIVVDL